MNFGNPLESLAAALYSALYVDLDPVEYQALTVQLKNEGKTFRDAPMAKRRPREEECRVFHFPQVWGSGALGFGGMGTASVTSAYTTVVVRRDEAAVYFAGRFAYKADARHGEFAKDLAAHSMKDVRSSGVYREAE